MNDRAGNSLLASAKLFELSPDHVDEGDRIGFLHEDKAAALGRLMAVDGQRDPIKVVANPDNPDRPWTLVAGRHRLVGARIEGITVFAIEVSGKPEELVDLEASENLHRRPLSPLERAKFTAALVTAAQERIARQHGNLTHQQRGIKKRWAQVKSGEIRVEQALKDETDDTSATIAQVYGWEESVSEALGMSKRTIHYDLTLYRLLIEPFPAEMVEALARHPIVGENGAQLKALAAIKDEGQRRAVIEQLLADPELSADDARVQAGVDQRLTGATPVAHQKFYDQIEGGWSRLGLTEKRRFIPNLAAMLHTADLKRDMRNQLNAELGDPAAPAPAQVKDIVGGLDTAFRVLLDLIEGDQPVDDERLQDALSDIQQGMETAKCLDRAKGAGQ